MSFLQMSWLLFPAGLANIAPLYAKFLFPDFSSPIDFGRKLKGQEIFGSHKTYRGFVAGILGGMLGILIQQVMTEKFIVMRFMSVIHYAELNIFWGGWIGFCALAGDLVKSFFKRRFRIYPGKSWFPFDQIDWVLGSIAGFSLLIQWTLPDMVLAIFTGLIWHLLIKYVGYYLHFETVKI